MSRCNVHDDGRALLLRVSVSIVRLGGWLPDVQFVYSEISVSPRKKKAAARHRADQARAA
ncbi:MAG TPA: hypothetical protein VEQ38_05150 [Verrucomicrobiae bacterium]|nr:hypothetical protein [Verrucomicrobiae bacterium]